MISTYVRFTPETKTKLTAISMVTHSSLQDILSRLVEQEAEKLKETIQPIVDVLLPHAENNVKQYVKKADRQENE